MIKNVVILIWLVLVVCCHPGSERSAASQRPNIIVILADDMGYSDLGCMGSEIETPNLDQLAQNGLLFTQCYNASRCCPSRASLLTGLYQHQAGMGFMVQDLGEPSYQGFLNEKCATIPELLKESGYQTIMAGKWHVGDEREHWPDKRGFDQFFGIPKGGGLYFYPSKFIDRPIYRNNELVTPDSSTFYTTDDFTDEAIKFLLNSEKKEAPFFMYLAYIAPHFPLQAWPEDIAKYEDKYMVGYEPIRQKRFERQKELGIIDQAVELSEPEYSFWDEERASVESQKMAVYAAMVDRLDQNVGKLIRYLKENDEFDNTLIFFLSDNGATAENVDRSPGAEIGTSSSFVSCGDDWANVSNTPFRKFKSQEFEGGIATPLIVHWPAGINSEGRKIRDIVHIMDIMPTCLEVAGVTYPSEFENRRLLPLSGNSISPIFKDESMVDDRLLFWEHMGNKAVRSKDVKLVKQRSSPWELYDLENDPTELHDLSSKKQDLTDSLEILWNEWAADHAVLEWPLDSEDK